MTNDYESYRTSMMTEMVQNGIDLDTVAQVISVMDMVSNQYRIERTGTALTTEVCKWRSVLRMYINSIGVEGYSVQTMKGRVPVVEKFFSTVGKDLEKVTTNDCRCWLFSMMNDVCDRTRNAYRITMSAFFKWCKTNGYIAENPMDNIKPIRFEKTQVEHLTKTEVEIVRSVLFDARERFIVEFLLSTGCRVSEFINVKHQDIDMRGDVWNVRVLGKGKKNRVVFMNAKAVLAYKEYMMSRNDNCEYVIVSARKTGGEVTQASDDSIERFCDSLERRVNGRISKKITPHVFRHTFATLSYENGMAIDKVQRMLGHESADTTMIYAECSTGDLMDAHMRFSTI